MKNYNTYIKNAIKKNPSLKQGLELESWLLELSLNVAELRKNKGYSQKEFAKKLGIAQSAVARIESGQNMKCSTLWKISEALDENLTIFGADRVSEKQKVNDVASGMSKFQRDLIAASAREQAACYEAVSTTSSEKINHISYAIPK